MNITIMGAGAWGTAVAVACSKQGHRVSLYSRRLEHALAMASVRENVDYLPGISLEYNLQILSEVAPAVMEAEVIVFACPSRGLKALANAVGQVRASCWGLKACITLCKGVDPEGLEIPTRLVAQYLPGLPVGVLSGPNNAAEVARGLPAAATLAFDTVDAAVAIEMQEAFSSPTLRIYRSTDCVGVSLGGVLKNIYALASGLAQGLGLGDNARAALLTRALREMVAVGTALGGQAETFYGLSGLGDLMATAYGPWSRNRSFGEVVGQGGSIKAILKQSRGVVEGYWAVEAFHKKIATLSIKTPILNALYQILYLGQAPKAIVLGLMNRPLALE